MLSREQSDERLTELEIKISYQEDLLDQLNQVVIKQQQDINFLVREVRALRQQMPQGIDHTFGTATEELPPHY